MDQLVHAVDQKRADGAMQKHGRHHPWPAQMHERQERQRAGEAERREVAARLQEAKKIAPLVELFELLGSQWRTIPVNRVNTHGVDLNPSNKYWVVNWTITSRLKRFVVQFYGPAIFVHPLLPPITPSLTIG